MQSKRLAPLAAVTAAALAIAACGSASSSKHTTTGASAAAVIDAVLSERIVGERRSGQEQLGTHSDRLPGKDPVPLAS